MSLVRSSRCSQGSDGGSATDPQPGRSLRDHDARSASIYAPRHDGEASPGSDPVHQRHPVGVTPRARSEAPDAPSVRQRPRPTPSGPRGSERAGHVCRVRLPARHDRRHVLPLQPDRRAGRAWLPGTVRRWGPRCERTPDRDLGLGDQSPRARVAIPGSTPPRPLLPRLRSDSRPLEPRRCSGHRPTPPSSGASRGVA